MNALNLPLVSAVITTHNRLDFLKLAVKSVIRQTYENIEIIVVDDNSTDGTVEYLDQLQAERTDLHHIHIGPEETKGGNYARNRGIDAAKGEYVAFLDDDDEWLPEKIEKQLTLFNEQVGLVYCGLYMEYIQEDSEPWRVEKPLMEEYVGDLSAKCLKKIFSQTSALMIRKDLLQEVGGFDESLRFWQETELCIRLCQITYVDAVREPLIILRNNRTDPNRLTNRYEGWLQAVAQINEKHKDLIDALPEEDKNQRSIMILKDGIKRCEQCGLRKEKKNALYEIWRITKNPKDYLKYLLNRPHLKPGGAEKR